MGKSSRRGEEFGTSKSKWLEYTDEHKSNIITTYRWPKNDTYLMYITK